MLVRFFSVKVVGLFLAECEVNPGMLLVEAPVMIKSDLMINLWCVLSTLNLK